MSFRGDQYVKNDSFNNDNDGNITFEFWLNSNRSLTSLLTSPKRFAGIGGTNDLYGIRFGYGLVSGALSFITCIQSTGCTAKSDYTMTITNNTWYFISGTYNGSLNSLYVNGKLVRNTTYTTTLAYGTTDTLTVGAINANPYYYFNGTIDELKISNVTHPSTWLETEYNNQKINSTMVSFGTEETYVSEESETTYTYPLTIGIVSCWNLSQTGNDTFENVNGSIQGSPSFINCKFGNCTLFDSTDDYVDFIDPQLLNLKDNFTIYTWINASSVIGEQSLIDKRRGFNSDGYQMRLNGGSTEFIIQDGSERKSSYAANIATNEWYMLNMIYTQGYILTYINGTLLKNESMGSGNVGIDTIANLRIGDIGEIAGIPSAYNFGGAIAVMAVWNRTLNQSEITQLYNSGNGLSCSNIKSGTGTTTPPLNSCTCPASGNWNVNLADNCVETVDCNMKQNTFTTYGTGNLYLFSRIYNAANYFLFGNGNIYCYSNQNCFS